MQSREVMFVLLGASCMLCFLLSVYEYRWAMGKRGAAAQARADAAKSLTQARTASSEGSAGCVLAFIALVAAAFVLFVTIQLLLGRPLPWTPVTPTPPPSF